MIQDFLGILIVGAGLSFLIEWINTKFGVDGNRAKALTLLLALSVGAIYVWIRSTPYWETAVLVLTSASAVYALIIKK